MTSLVFLILGLGPTEIGLIVFFALLMFGGKKLPELMRGVGKGIREFNSARAGVEDEIRKGINDTDKKAE